jgi:ribokinase
MDKIVVIGSSNTDMVIQTRKFPMPGETVMGSKFFMNPGGKGANQAVAAARLGAEVAFVAKVGRDVFGRQAVQNLMNEGIDVTGVFQDSDNPSGVAQIIVDAKAENCIVVAPGANMLLDRGDIDQSIDHIKNCSILLLQLESPLDTILYAAQKANDLNKMVILNPAPAATLPDDLLPLLYLITPNETETELLTGIRVKDDKSADEAAKVLQSKGVKNVIITLGSRGAWLLTGNIGCLIPAPIVDAVDTTAAGDTFNGALASAMYKGYDLNAAVIFANKAAAIAVTKMGAQASIPYYNEVIGF